jgi:hypothetical protein
MGEIQEMVRVRVAMALQEQVRECREEAMAHLDRDREIPEGAMAHLERDRVCLVQIFGAREEGGENLISLI